MKKLMIAAAVAAMTAGAFAASNCAEEPDDPECALVLNVKFSGKTATETETKKGDMYKTVQKISGKGTLVMSDTFNGQSGFAKNFGSAASLTGSLLVDDGTLKVEASGQLGGGTVLLAEGARMEVSPGVTLSNRIDGSPSGTIEYSCCHVIW